jgi:hypothetical protein
MAKINSIVTWLNDSLKATAFGDSRFAGTSYNGIAQTVPSGTDREVVCADENGKPINSNLFYSDTFPMVIYHRIASSKWILNNKDSFGRKQGYLRQMEMQMIISYDKSRIHLNSEDLETLIYFGFPQSIPGADLTGGLKSCTFSLSQMEHNQLFLIEREFQMKNYSLWPRAVLTEARYKIECDYSPDCINVICCPD